MEGNDVNQVWILEKTNSQGSGWALDVDNLWSFFIQGFSYFFALA